jgi:hypothetical protein
VADFRRSGQSQGAGCFRAVVVLPSLVCKSNIEADFLTSFQLHHPPVVDHQLDRSVADGPEGLTQLPEQGGSVSSATGWVVAGTVE